MKKRTESCRRRGLVAFTLLEVLAAVAILGIWFTVLANAGIQGLRAEGRNHRQLRASLLADRTLTQLEMDLEDGIFPEAGLTENDGEREDEDDGGSGDEFRVEIETTRFEDVDFDEAENSLLSALEEAPTLYEESHVVEIRVIWTEGHDEQVVTRTTYAWNRVAFDELMATLPDGEEGENPASGGQDAPHDQGGGQ